MKGGGGEAIDANKSHNSKTCIAPKDKRLHVMLYASQTGKNTPPQVHLPKRSTVKPGTLKKSSGMELLNLVSTIPTTKGTIGLEKISLVNQLIYHTETVH